MKHIDELIAEQRLDPQNTLEIELTQIYSEARLVIPALRGEIESVFQSIGIDSKILFLDHRVPCYDFETNQKREVAAMLLNNEYFEDVFRDGLVVSDFSGKMEDHPVAILMLLMTDKDILNSFVKQYRRLHLFETPQITLRQTLTVAAGFAWLIVVLFSVMTLSGGHQAATGAIEFFNNF